MSTKPTNNNNNNNKWRKKYNHTAVRKKKSHGDIRYCGQMAQSKNRKMFRAQFMHMVEALNGVTNNLIVCRALLNHTPYSINFFYHAFHSAFLFFQLLFICKRSPPSTPPNHTMTRLATHESCRLLNSKFAEGKSGRESGREIFPYTLADKFHFGFCL